MPDSSTLRTLGGKTALITGTASGMGRATAVLFAEDGAHVAMLDRDAAGLEETAQLIADAGGRCEYRVVDMADAAAVRAAIASMREATGPYDVLVNNAGVSVPIRIEDDGYEAAWETIVAVNLTACTTTIRACLEDLKRDATGRIVNIASTEGLGATASNSPYAASKHGVVGLTRGLAVELASQGVTVNAVCPGPIHTGMTSMIPDDAKTKFARRRVPMRRYGEPHEVAHMTWSLCLPGASFVNGAIVQVDGGLIAQNT